MVKYPEDSHPIQNPESAFSVMVKSLHWLDKKFN